MLILKGDNGKSRVVETILKNTKSICFIYYDEQIPLEGIWVDSSQYSIEELREGVVEYLEKDNTHYEYVILYTNLPEEKINMIPWSKWIGWICKNVIVTCK